MKVKLDKWDTLWGKLVRERDGCCRKCGKVPPYQLQAHHILPRGRSATRYDLANGITLCVHHHTFGDDSVHRVGKQFVIDLIGLKEYKRLEKLSNQTMSREKARKGFITQYAPTQ
mgnify:CR=1 FL=1